MKYSFLMMLALHSSKAILNPIQPLQNEKDSANIMQMVQFHKYPILEYDVLTADGYKIGLHRIPGPRHENIMESLKVHR